MPRTALMAVSTPRASGARTPACCRWERPRRRRGGDRWAWLRAASRSSVICARCAAGRQLAHGLDVARQLRAQRHAGGGGHSGGLRRVGKVGGHAASARPRLRWHRGRRRGGPLYEAPTARSRRPVSRARRRAARERLLLALHEPHRLERIARGARREDLRAGEHRRNRCEPEAQAPGDAEQRRMRTPPGRRRGAGNRGGGRHFALHLSACDISRNQNDAVLIQCWNVRASCAPRPGAFRGRHRINAAKTAVAPRRREEKARAGGASGRGEMRSMSYTRAIDEERREA